MTLQTREVHTPGTLVRCFSATLRAPEASRILSIRGTYEAKRGRAYAGYHYDNLLEETGEGSMTLKVPELLRAGLEPGTPYVFEGALEKRVTQRGAVELIFVVSDILAREERRVTDQERRAADLLRKKRTRATGASRRCSRASSTTTSAPLLPSSLAPPPSCPKTCEAPCGRRVTTSTSASGAPV